MSHTAELIAVGTELLLGNIVNTNARDISQALSAVGVNVFWHTVVGDNPQRLKEALDIARKRADVIITTGGLGPTYDDLTKQTICEAFGKPLVLHQDILDGIRTFFERNAHREMPKNNIQQAELPEGCTVFDNPVGTAPGCAFESDGVHVLMLPGPPFEMLTMLKRHVIPYLRALSDEVIVSHDIMTFGLGESPMEELLRDKMSHMENPSLATYAKPSEVRLRATAKAGSVEEAEAMLAPVVGDVTAFLGNYVYGVDVASLEEVCFRLLREKGVAFENNPNLDIREYIHDMPDCLAAADLVIARAGAMTLAELTALGRASVLIPSPNVAENHQYHNAMVLENHHAAVVIEEKDLTGEKLAAVVRELTADPTSYAAWISRKGRVLYEQGA